MGFVSNSSSSSFLCLGVSNEILIEKLLEAEGFKKNEDGWYEGEGYGCLEGKNITYFGGSNNGWICAGLNENETVKLLEACNLPEARKSFQKMIKSKLKIEIPLKNIGLSYGEASSE